MTTTVRPLGEADLDAWLRIRTASFGARPEPDEELRTLLRRRLPFSYGAEAAEGGLAAVASWYPYRAWVGGVRVGVGGLAGVVSAPEGRRRGHVRALMRDGLERLRGAGVGFALEHPFDPRFYAAFGFRTVPASVRLELPLERAAGDPRRVDFVPLADDPVADLIAVHDVFAQRHGFALDRTFRTEGEAEHARWHELFEDEPGWDPPTAYRCEGGYAIVRTGRPGGVRLLDVLDAAWVDDAARTRVLDLLGAWRGQSERLRIDLPHHDPLARDEGPAHAVPRPPLQARIVDLGAALRPLRAPFMDARVAGTRAGREFVLRVRDGFCPWNDGAWRIVPGPQGCVVSAVDEEAEVTVSIEGLTSLLTGTPPARLAQQDEADGNLEALWGLARTTADQPPFLGAADYF